jgi:hypothetical protein
VNTIDIVLLLIIIGTVIVSGVGFYVHNKNENQDENKN